MNINYPILNISTPKWSNDIVDELFRYDDIYYSNDETFFESYFLNHKFVDSNGDIFKLYGKVPIKAFWVRLFTLKRSLFQFEATNEKMTFSEIKNLMITRINDLEGEEAKNQWIARLEKANSIQELIE